MARILHVANFGRKASGAFHHSVEYKLSNGLTRNGHHVVNVSDRDLARMGSWLGHRQFGVAAANKEFRSLCRNMEPELLLLGHADVIEAATIADLRRELPAMRVAQWNVDALFTPANITRIASKLEVVDATLVSTAGAVLGTLARPGKVLGYLPNPVDFSVESGACHEKRDLPFDLFFACGDAAKRRWTCGEAWLPSDLRARIEGAIPGLRALTPGLNGQPSLVGARYQRALESAAIGLNLSQRNDYYLYSSDRLAQLCGNGLAVLIDRATGFDALFGEDEFAFFAGVDEMVERIRHLKGDAPARQALAGKGRTRYHALFNERVIAKYMVDAAFGTIREADFPWPTIFHAESATR